jgi:hypothetical protein
MLVLGSGARQHGDEPPTQLGDGLHVLLGAELRICDVEEVHLAGQVTQGLPGFQVRDGVVGVAIPHAELAGDAVIRAGGQDREKLLEIRTVILRVTVGDPRRPVAADRAPASRSVLPCKPDRR